MIIRQLRIENFKKIKDLLELPEIIRKTSTYTTKQKPTSIIKKNIF